MSREVNRSKSLFKQILIEAERQANPIYQAKLMAEGFSALKKSMSEAEWQALQAKKNKVRSD